MPNDLPRPQTGVKITYSLDLEAADSKPDAIRTSVAILRKRLYGHGLRSLHVEARGDRLVVELPGLDAETMSQVRDLISRPARFAVHAVEHDAPFMQALAAHVPGDPAAIEAGIDVERILDGKRRDTYLRARDRVDLVSIESAGRFGCFHHDDGDVPAGGRIRCPLSGRMVIEQYVRDLAAQDARFALPRDRQIAYEHVADSPRAPGLTPAPAHWRTYYVERTAGLTGASIARARAVRGADVPQIAIELDREGGRSFGELTARGVGKKLAIVVDDRVTSAPVIMEPIRGGRMTITVVGRHDRTLAERDARDLALALETGALPAPLREETVEELR